MAEKFEMDQISTMNDVENVEIAACQTEYEVLMSDDFAKWFGKILSMVDWSSEWWLPFPIGTYTDALNKIRSSESLNQEDQVSFLVLFGNEQFELIADKFLNKLAVGTSNVSKMRNFIRLMFNNEWQFAMEKWQRYFANVASDTLLKQESLKEVVSRLETEWFEKWASHIKQYGVINYTMEEDEEHNKNPLFDVCKAEWDNVELVDFLIKNGADKNLANKEWNSLYFAVQKRNVKIIELLHDLWVYKYAMFGTPPVLDDALTYLIKDCKGHEDTTLIKYFLDSWWFDDEETDHSRWGNRFLNATEEIKDKVVRNYVKWLLQKAIKTGKKNIKTWTVSIVKEVENSAPEETNGAASLSDQEQVISSTTVE